MINRLRENTLFYIGYKDLIKYLRHFISEGKWNVDNDKLETLMNASNLTNFLFYLKYLTDMNPEFCDLWIVKAIPYIWLVFSKLGYFSRSNFLECHLQFSKKVPVTQNNTMPVTSHTRKSCLWQFLTWPWPKSQIFALDKNNTSYKIREFYLELKKLV